MLANRRCNKFLNSIENARSELRDGMASEAFRYIIQQHEAVLDRILDHARDDRKPENVVHLGVRRLAVCRALLTASQFGEQRRINEYAMVRSAEHLAGHGLDD